MSMKTKIITMFQDVEHELFEDVILTINNRLTTSEDIYIYLRRVEDLINQGYIVDSCFVTSDDIEYHKKALNSSLTMLQSYKEFQERFENKFKDNEDLRDTANHIVNLHKKEVKRLMNIVGRRCERCLVRDIEVDDEIALQCCDLYKKGLI